MRRREFIAALGGAAAWPLAARAQQPAQVPRVGLLMLLPEKDPQTRADRDALETELRALGWTLGQNIQLEYRWTGGDQTLMQKYAVELVGMSPDVLVTEGAPAVAATLRATKSLPIIFVNVTDPVEQGFVASLTRPGGNATGFTLYEFSMGTKWVEILRQVAPTVKHIGFLFNPASAPYSDPFFGPLQAVAALSEIDAYPIAVAEDAEIERSLAELAKQPDSGLVVPHDPFLIGHRDFLIAQIARHRIPAVYALRLFARSGGLISYGFDLAYAWHEAATYIDRVLKGANPGELPVQEPIKLELVINLKAAEALEITVPEMLLLNADEVIK
jgi:putative tryptophan/tyrosine transport system substrate-binding protein